MSLSINSAIGAGAGSVSTGGQPRTGISGLDKLMAEPSSISRYGNVEGSIHTVKEDETLEKIAKEHGTTWQRLKQINGLSDADIIKIGDKIRLPSKKADEAPTGTVLKPSKGQLGLAKAMLAERGMPTNHLSKVEFIKGMEGHGPKVEAARLNGNPAITLGNKIYVRDDFWAKATDPSRETFWSEIVHTSQYQLGSFSSNYISGVIGSALLGGDGHKDNIMETVAHRLGGEMSEAWKNR